MADDRFPSPGVDERFPAPGVDIEHDPYPTDARFPAPGTDTRFEGGYSSGPVNIVLPTVAPALTNGEYKVGTQYTLSGASADPSGGGVVSYVYYWIVNGVEQPAGASYTPVDGDYARNMSWKVEYVETGGTNAGTVTRTGGTARITATAPTVANPLGAQLVAENYDQPQTIDTSAVFAGLGVNQSDQTPARPSGVTFDAVNERYNIAADVAFGQTSMVLRGTNLDGSDDDNWTLETAPLVLTVGNLANVIFGFGSFGGAVVPLQWLGRTLSNFNVGLSDDAFTLQNTDDAQWNGQSQMAISISGFDSGNAQLLDWNGSNAYTATITGLGAWMQARDGQDVAIDIQEPIPVVPAVLSQLVLGPQPAPNDDVPIDYTIDKDSLTDFVLLVSTATAPNADQVRAGTDGDDNAAADSFSQTLTTTGSPIDVAMADGLDDTYILYGVPANSSVVTVSNSTPINTVTTSPVTPVYVDVAQGPGGTLRNDGNENIAGLITGAGEYIVYVNHSQGGAVGNIDGLISGTGITSASRIGISEDTGAGLTIECFFVVASAAATFNYQQRGNPQSFQRSYYSYSVAGATDADAIFVGNVAASNTASTTLPSVPTGYGCVSSAVFANTTIPPVTWSDDFAGAEDDENAMGAGLYASVASLVSAAAGGNLTATATIASTPRTRIAAVAVKAA